MPPQSHTSYRARPPSSRDVGARLFAVALALAAGGTVPRAVAAQTPPEADGAAFAVVESTIAEIHAAYRGGRLTAHQLVQRYLDRIAAYDQSGPAINALITMNPRALAVADSLDAYLRRTGEFAGPLHGIPVIVKDNYDTHDLPTTGGSLSLEGSVPPDDAYQVRKLREAGAIVLAKSNMAEFAFSPYETVGSMLPGYTRNPYALDRVTAGSSGGTAAAVAANLGEVGLGTDTGNSIRGPSSHNALVGIRSTMGLTSRDGIIPLYLDRDIGGPIARTVEDAVRVFDVIAGYDPADSVTAASRGRMPPEGYRSHLKRDGLVGKRIGVLRRLSNTRTADPEVLERFEQALADLRRAGAVVVDSVEIPDYEEIRRASLWCRRFKWDIEAYLASLGPDAPVHTLEEIIESDRYHPSIEQRLRFMQSVEKPPAEDESCREAVRNTERLRAAVRTALSDGELDALVYPSWNNPPRKIGDLNSPHGNNSPYLAPPTGFPAVTVPMGWVRDGRLPVGLQILGDAWSEPVLIEIAYAYEQATHHRHSPPSAPPLGKRLVLTPQESGTTALLQAVSPVDERVAWASGHEGTYLRTTDGGETWQAARMPGADTLEFRDVYAVDGRTAYLLSAGPGELSRIYKTTDAGRSWTLQFQNEEPQAFFDCLDFWDPRRGLAFSDAVDGEFIILVTSDGGETWTRVLPERVPDAPPGGAGAFAASGTCVVAGPDGRAWIGIGAGTAARVLRTEDYGATWSVAETPIVAGESAGVFSLAFRDATHGVALGGDLSRASEWTANIAVTEDGGQSWSAGGRPILAGPLFGGAYVPGARTPTLVAVAPTGLDYSLDDGRTWIGADTQAYWAVGLASPAAGWAVGPGGRIVKIEWQ